MIDLKTAVRRGRTRAPIKTCVYGGPGVGKTTFGSRAPGAVVLPAEEGANQLGVDRLTQPQSWPEALDMLSALAHQTHDWTTVVVDTIGALEDLAVTHLCESDKVPTLNDYGGGYGRGTEAINNEWRMFLRRLEVLNEKGLNVILLAHAQVKTFTDPSLGSYDRYIPALRESTWARTHRWCDDVLFARKSTGIAKGKGETKARVTFGEERELLTTSATGFEAKNRHGLPKRMALSWAEYEAGLAAFYADPLAVRDRIAALAVATKNEDLVLKVAAVVKEAGEDTKQLALIESQLREKIETMKVEAA